MSPREGKLISPPSFFSVADTFSSLPKRCLKISAKTSQTSAAAREPEPNKPGLELRPLLLQLEEEVVIARPDEVEIEAEIEAAVVVVAEAAATAAPTIL